MNILFLDLSTLSFDATYGTVNSISGLLLDLNEPCLDYEKLLEQVVTMKFNVIDQYQKYKRSIDKEVLDWWLNQSESLKKVIIRKEHESSLLEEIHTFFLTDGFKNPDLIFTRGMDFDLKFLDGIYQSIGKPFPLSRMKFRDTRSFLDGAIMAIGDMKIKNDFMLDEYKDHYEKHNPAHEVVMDAIRVQTILGLEP